MDKNDKIFVLGGVGILAAIVFITFVRPKVSTTNTSDGGYDVESQIGARVPHYSRNGHYGAYGILCPLEWEKHRMAYPRRPVPWLQTLMETDLPKNHPAYPKEDVGWFENPPAEQYVGGFD